MPIMKTSGFERERELSKTSPFDARRPSPPLSPSASRPWRHKNCGDCALAPAAAPDAAAPGRSKNKTNNKTVRKHKRQTARSAHRMQRAARLALLAFGAADAFYLPGVAPREYAAGEKVELKVNKLTSTKTQPLLRESIAARTFSARVMPLPNPRARGCWSGHCGPQASGRVGRRLVAGEYPLPLLPAAAIRVLRAPILPACRGGGGGRKLGRGAAGRPHHELQLRAEDGRGGVLQDLVPKTADVQGVGRLCPADRAGLPRALGDGQPAFSHQVHRRDQPRQAGHNLRPGLPAGLPRVGRHTGDGSRHLVPK
eukprot:scaffold5788_cov95-Isochrysis_galbana.AAC.4